ncbi:pim proto-oncogene, serine/threonine kinase,-related 123 [Plakobranchus ocellatus]|uniref:Pim proto-oncogene, serine/threonine kinase,-related 123 n=1 Tax=Plakobranchus ocellatus TaxID=259542 RepID=A0AAV4AZD0_9GAST|nr:pim proto-oncogene, serine/threonine kinase,-related 123 [Plakobranchus ocellatus]
MRGPKFKSQATPRQIFIALLCPPSTEWFDHPVTGPAVLSNVYNPKARRATRGKRNNSSHTQGIERSLVEGSHTQGIERSLVEGSHTPGIEKSLFEGSHTQDIERSLVKGSHTQGIERSLVEGSHMTGIGKSLVEGSHTQGIERSLVEGTHEHCDSSTPKKNIMVEGRYKTNTGK